MNKESRRKVDFAIKHSVYMEGNGTLIHKPTQIVKFFLNIFFFENAILQSSRVPCSLTADKDNMISDFFFVSMPSHVIYFRRLSLMNFITHEITAMCTEWINKALRT